MTPPFLPLEPIQPLDLSPAVRRVAGLAPVKELKAKFPQRAAGSTTLAKSALRRWQESQPDPPSVRNPDLPVKAVPPTAANLKQLRSVIGSGAVPAAMLKEKMDPESFFGSLYSALTTNELLRMQGEYKKRKRTEPADKVEKQWQEVRRAAKTAYAVGGLRGLEDADLDRFAKELAGNRATLNTLSELAKKAVPLDKNGVLLTTTTPVFASFLPVVEKYIDPSIIITPILDLCDDPIAQGSFTKHFSRSIELFVKIRYWCPTWTNPTRMCTKKIILAGVSFSVGVNVGYKVNCCGATAWGQAYAQVCATIIGIQVCASCSATIVGVAGISRTPVASGCSYGLGINATLKCTLAGITIYQATVPFGWTITGPCPPAGLCK